MVVCGAEDPAQDRTGKVVAKVLNPDKTHIWREFGGSSQSGSCPGACDHNTPLGGL